MSPLILAASLVASPPVSASAEARAVVRIERPAIVTAQQWKTAPPEVKRHERIIKDEHGEPQLQRVLDYE